MTFGFGLGLNRGGGAGGLIPALAANFIGGSLPTGSTFSRGTTGTYYNQSGLITTNENLLTYSVWPGSGGAGTYPSFWSVTGNGTLAVSCAQEVVQGVSTGVVYYRRFNGSSGYEGLQPTTPITYPAGTQVTASIFVRIPAGVTATTLSYYDGVNLTQIATAATLAAQPVGTWVRYSVTLTAASAGTYGGAFISAAPIGVGTGFDLAMPQVQYGGNVSQYNPTTSAAVYGPRFDYDPNPANYVQQNLALYSQDFTNAAWAAARWGGGATVTANDSTYVAPDGTTTVSKVVATLGGSGVGQSVSLTAGTTYTFSTWVVSPSSVQIIFASTPNAGGAVAITNVTPNGLLTRYTVSYTAATTGTYYVGIDDTVALQTFYAWGAQLNVGSTALPYLATTTTAQTICAPKGLLIEETRTNLCLQSGFVSGWTAIRSTATQNAGVSPDGTTDAYLITEDSTVTNSHYLLGSSITIANATAYTTSYYAKANGRTWIAIQGDIASGFLGLPQYFDIGNGVVGTLAGGVTSASIQSVGNGWFRCLVTATSTSTTASPGLFLATGQSVSFYTGNGTSGVYLYGAQLEAGAFATSYIPTTSATVTRNADNLGITVISSWYNTAQGTFLAAFDANYLTASGRIIGTQTAATPLSIVSTGGAIALYDGALVNTSNVISTNTVAKAASTYVGSSFTICLNGATPTSGTGAGSFPFSGVTAIYFGSQAGTQNFLSGHLRSFSYYNYALTNTQLQGITT